MNEPKTRSIAPGVRCQAWGIFGGPYAGTVLERGQGKDCWVVKLDNGGRVELHEDYIQTRADKYG